MITIRRYPRQQRRLLAFLGSFLQILDGLIAILSLTILDSQFHLTFIEWWMLAEFRWLKKAEGKQE